MRPRPVDESVDGQWKSGSFAVKRSETQFETDQLRVNRALGAHGAAIRVGIPGGV